MSSLSDLAGKYTGRPAYIVGKGPSLAHLTAAHFPDPSGPVIILNDAILKVQTLGLPNDLYSLQKDGCGYRSAAEQCKPDCGDRPHMVYPQNESITLIQQREYSPFCLPRHKNKIWIETVAELGIELPQEMAVIMAIKIALLMGCSRLVMVSCDSLVDPQELRTYNPQTGESQCTDAGIYYRHARERVLQEIECVNHQIITPEAEDDN